MEGVLTGRCAMSVVFRTVFSDDRADLISEATTLFTSWLASKQLAVDGPEMGRVEADGTTIEVVRAADGDLEAIRMRLDEESTGQRWSTIMTAMATGDEAWVWLDVERVSDNIYGPPPSFGTPRIVRDFLNSSTCRAGSTVLRSTFQVADDDTVGDLLNELLDPARTVPVVVVSRDTSSPGATRARAEELARALVGIANVWALEGLATSALSQALGPNLHVFGGAVRTYLPGLTISDGDHRRHRFAGRELFQPHPRPGAQVVARSLVARAVAARPPLLFRNRVALLPGFTRRGRDEEQLLADLVQAEGERDDLQHKLDLQILETTLQTEEIAAEAEAANSRVRWLEQQLRQANVHVAGVATPESDIPTNADSCIRALDLAQQYLDLVEVGDTLTPAEKLDRHAKVGTWGGKAWEAFRALQSYAEAKSSGNWTGNFLLFCRACPSGFDVIQADWVATGENETTANNPRFRRARTFRVPTAVSSDGEVYMGEHIKLEKGSDPAPRIHFWDDTAGDTGKIYIGYLGRHLPSSDTN